MNSPLWVYALGMLGILIYGSRILIQWWQSEKSHRVESPAVYWVLASIGAIVLLIYGWLRKDFSIIFAECLGYYAYMWNISILGLYKNVPRWIIWLQALFPVVVVGAMLWDLPAFRADFLHNADMPPELLLFGVIAQFTYEIRSVYQLVYCYRRRESILPLGHWILAVVGSALVIIYGLIRHDWVLVIGQFSIIFSIRNLIICINQDKLPQPEPQETQPKPDKLEPQD